MGLSQSMYPNALSYQSLVMTPRRHSLYWFEAMELPLNYCLSLLQLPFLLSPFPTIGCTPHSQRPSSGPTSRKATPSEVFYPC